MTFAAIISYSTVYNLRIYIVYVLSDRSSPCQHTWQQKRSYVLVCVCVCVADTTAPSLIHCVWKTFQKIGTKRVHWRHVFSACVWCVCTTRGGVVEQCLSRSAQGEKLVRGTKTRTRTETRASTSSRRRRRSRSRAWARVSPVVGDRLFSAGGAGEVSM